MFDFFQEFTEFINSVCYWGNYAIDNLMLFLNTARHVFLDYSVMSSFHMAWPYAWLFGSSLAFGTYKLIRRGW